MYKRQTYSHSRVYGSQSYDAEKSQLERQDLNGLRFCGLPWLITPQKWQDSSEVLSINKANYDRLYAFGADAWTVSQQLNNPKKHPIAGRTGLLNLIKGKYNVPPFVRKSWMEKQLSAKQLLGQVPI